MSDWEDEDYSVKPKMAAPAPVRYTTQQQNYDDWDVEPSNKTNRHDNHSRSSSSNRDSGGKRSNYNNNNYNNLDCSDGGQENQVAFTVGKSSVGTIIGRGGSKIRDLETQYHVKLNIGKCDLK